jgi:DNA-binding response OmpR family regulator
MKTLWVEDHPHASELLAAAAVAASRKRLGLDLVLADTLLSAERKLRLERFDLVVVDLLLPDSPEEYATVTRIANMGQFRVAVVSASDRRQDAVDALARAGVDCAPRAIAKEEISFSEFARRPETLRDFLFSLLPEGERGDGRVPDPRAADDGAADRA